MVDQQGIASLIGELGRSDEEGEAPLCAELDRLFACPQVRPPAPDAKIFFNFDSKRPLGQQRGQQRGLRVTLWCCGQRVTRCNDKRGELACPSFLDAVQLFRGRVQAEHSSVDCLERAAAKRSQAEALQPAMPRAPRNAFEAMAAGAIAGQRLSSTVTRVQRELGEVAKAESALADKRKSLSAELSQQVESLENLSKKPKSAAGSRCSSTPAAAAPPPYWAAWDLDTFKRLEALRHARRQQALSDEAPPRPLPRGQRDGPLWHERRGLVGAVQEWAGGSRSGAAHLISKLIQELDVGVRSCLVGNKRFVSCNMPPLPCTRVLRLRRWRGAAKMFCLSARHTPRQRRPFFCR